MPVNRSFAGFHVLDSCQPSNRLCLGISGRWNSKPFFQPIHRAAPLGRSGLADGVLVAEETNFLHRLFQGNRLQPLHGHEPFTALGVSSQLAMVVACPKRSGYGKRIKNQRTWYLAWTAAMNFGHSTARCAAIDCTCGLSPRR